MKTQLVTLLALVSLNSPEAARLPKKRDSILQDYTFATPQTQNAGWKVNTADFNLNVELPPPRRPQPPISVLHRPQPPLTVSNSIDKPIQEGQDLVPPQNGGAAILPQMPVPAVPVNAAASNIPASGGAVFLGSGSLGVVSLGNGAYALGSGSLGYSENRARPRPTAQVPAYPPIRASPDLLPAAVPTQQPPQIPLLPPASPGFDFSQSVYNLPQVPQIDQNGYEYLQPNRVAFGSPLPPRPIRTRQQFATPTALQLQPQVPQPGNLQFGTPLQSYPFLA